MLSLSGALLLLMCVCVCCRLLSVEGRRAAEQLLALTELINQTVGDAISDLLMVEVILLHRQVSGGWGGMGL